MVRSPLPLVALVAVTLFARASRADVTPAPTRSHLDDPLAMLPLPPEVFALAALALVAFAIAYVRRGRARSSRAMPRSNAPR